MGAEVTPSKLFNGAPPVATTPACIVDATVCVGVAPPALSAQNHKPQARYLAPPVYLVTLVAFTW